MKLIELKPPVKQANEPCSFWWRTIVSAKMHPIARAHPLYVIKVQRTFEVGKIGFILKLKQVYFNHILLHYNWHYPIIPRI